MISHLPLALPTGFDGVFAPEEHERAAAIRYRVISSATSAQFMRDISGRQVSAHIYYGAEHSSYAHLMIDGVTQVTLIFDRRSRDFASRVTLAALRGVASRVGKHRRHATNKALKGGAE